MRQAPVRARIGLVSNMGQDAIELEFSPPNPDYVTVEVDGVLIDYVETCDGMNGWTFVPDTDNLFIELCGSACTDFQQGGEVHVVQDCPPQG